MIHMEVAIHLNKLISSNKFYYFQQAVVPSHRNSFNINSTHKNGLVKTF